MTRIVVGLSRRLRKVRYFLGEFEFIKNKSIETISGLNNDSSYEYFNYFYNFRLPKKYRRHREYFVQNQRGFGEDAFHAFWYVIFHHYNPHTCLEIGVYRGQVISLWNLLAEDLKIESCEIWGLSPLTQAGDNVSQYLDLDYELDILRNFEFFGLQRPKLMKVLSTSPGGVEFIKSCAWDLIYIDGSHDYQDVKNDFENSWSALRKGGLLVLDDSSLYLGYQPRIGRFAGHPGPSRLMKEILDRNVRHLMTVGHLNLLQKV